MIGVALLCVAIFGMPPWLIKTPPAMVAHEETRGKVVDLTEWRVDQLELSTKTLDEKSTLTVLGLQKAVDRLDAIDRRMDDTRWWIGVIIATLGVLVAMKSPDMIERWRKRT